MQIAFWSTVHGQTGTTSNAIAIACMIALEYRLKTLITHNQFDKSTLEAAFLEKEYLLHQNLQLKDQGIDALGRAIQYHRLEEDAIPRYTTSLLKNRLELLAGTQNTNKDLYYSDYISSIDLILENLRNQYDLLMIDVASGRNDFTDKILEQSDLIVVNLNQNRYVMEDFFNQAYEKVKDKCFIVLGMYNATSKYCVKNLQRQFKTKTPLNIIPYNRAFADAYNEGKVIDYFLKNMDSQKTDMDYGFIKEVKKSAVNLLIQLGIDIKNKKIGDS